MKLITTILLLICFKANATVYYISNAGSNANNGTTTITAWQTIAHAIATISSGDSILFKKGDSWNERLNVPANNIYFGSYGTGAKPIITGFQNLTGWTNVGNIWSSTFANSVKYQNTVYIGGLKQKGRYPNTDYLTFTSHSGLNQITGALTGTPNYTGGQIAIRNVGWVINTGYITSQSAGTLNFSPNSYYALNDNYGYFIQNIESVLDLQNEWCYDTTTTVIKVYSTAQPTAKGSTIDTLINVTGRSNITFNGLQIEGANMAGFEVANTTNVTITNCVIKDCGADAVKGYNSDYLTVRNCTINDCWNDAVILLDFTAVANWNDSYGVSITGNTIYNIATSAGMGKNGNQAYTAIDLFGNKGNISYNTLRNVGYIPIFFYGDSTEVTRNFIDTFCFVKDDGGGIYTNGTFNGRVIKKNIILNGIGARAGTSSAGNIWTYGIYLDDNTRYVNVDSNNVAYCASAGMSLNNAGWNNIRHNTFAYNGNESTIGASGPQVTNVQGPNTITNNIIYGDLSLALINMTNIGTTYELIGTLDSNQYAKPLDDSTIIKFLANYRSLSVWKSYGLYDLFSTGTPTGITTIKPLFFYNNTSSLKAISLGGTYKDINGNSFTSVAYLPEFSSLVLFKSVTNIPVIKNASASIGYFKLKTL